MNKRIIAREGGIVYTRRGDDVYYALPGCLPRYYCGIARWPQSPAARRLRGELGPRARRTVAEVLAEDAALAAERARRQARALRLIDEAEDAAGYPYQPPAASIVED